jgi:hypothetical protein
MWETPECLFLDNEQNTHNAAEVRGTTPLARLTRKTIDRARVYIKTHKFWSMT